MTQMMNKCYACTWVRDVPGSAHKACAHPEVTAQTDEPLLAFFAALASAGRIKPYALPKLGVTGDPHGIKNGWFNFPWNFDPVWLNSCDGFTPKEAKP